MQSAYEYYMAARDAAWKTLIDCRITSLPVDLSLIASHYQISIVTYSKSPISQVFAPEVLSGDGFITKILGNKIIYLNDKVNNRSRRRFTVGHELGHGILGHPLDNIEYRNSEMDSRDNPLEMQANVFSRDILAPACVLDALDAVTPDAIMLLCDISRQSAEIRAQRLELLRRRGAFLKSPLERQVLEQFAAFIQQNKR